jgi:hypothetical protein
MTLCGGAPVSTRAVSPRQLPTDHDYAVSTREYQSDQPSRIALRPPPMLHPVIERRPGVEETLTRLPG